MRLRGDNVIHLSVNEVIKLCKPGDESDTCIWLMYGLEGSGCRYYNRPTGLVSRWNRGLTVAKRDGCPEVRALGLEVRYTEATSLADIMESMRGK